MGCHEVMEVWWMSLTSHQWHGLVITKGLVISLYRDYIADVPTSPQSSAWSQMRSQTTVEVILVVSYVLSCWAAYSSSFCLSVLKISSCRSTVEDLTAAVRPFRPRIDSRKVQLSISCRVAGCCWPAGRRACRKWWLIHSSSQITWYRNLSFLSRIRAATVGHSRAKRMALEE